MVLYKINPKISYKEYGFIRPTESDTRRKFHRTHDLAPQEPCNERLVKFTSKDEFYLTEYDVFIPLDISYWHILLVLDTDTGVFSIYKELGESDACYIADDLDNLYKSGVIQKTIAEPFELYNIMLKSFEYNKMIAEKEWTNAVNRLADATNRFVNKIIKKDEDTVSSGLAANRKGRVFYKS